MQAQEGDFHLTQLITHIQCRVRQAGQGGGREWSRAIIGEAKQHPSHTERVRVSVMVLGTWPPLRCRYMATVTDTVTDTAGLD